MFSGESDDPEGLLDEIKKYVRRCRDNGLDKEDFERERRCHYASFVTDFDSTEDIAFALTSYAYDEIDIFKYPDIVGSISFEYVVSLLDLLLEDDKFTLSVIKP